MTPLRLSWCIAAAAAMTAALGCGATTMRVASLDEVERIRAAGPLKDAAAAAPEIYARAEHEREDARAAHARGDDVGANLYAERAIAAYGHAQAAARLATAIAALADSQKSLDDDSVQEQSLAAVRAKIEQDAQDLERRTRVARERLAGAAGGAANGDVNGNSRAALAAARSLALEARLLCGAAHLVVAAGASAADATGLADADGEVEKLDATLAQPASPTPADRGPMDAAGALRARCLDVLTHARRSAATTGSGSAEADALIAELSASGGWDPTRDERGVVVTLRGVFAGAALTGDGKAKLESLGRVAAAHSGFGLQIVVHDAFATAAKDTTDARRADAAQKALVTGGASATHLAAALAGVQAPLVDPDDARLRRRNERIDVVFVGG